MKFAIITYILHKENNQKYYSYEPYVREMNIWINSIDEIIIVAPKISSSPENIETSYLHSKIDFHKIPEISWISFPKFLQSFIKLPEIIFKILKVMKRADHIHIRCPGNISLIACVLQIFFPQKPKTVKYAGNWDPNAKQPWSYNLQKKLLGNTFLTRNMKVLVYGEWPNQSKNILPFFTASFHNDEIPKNHIEKPAIINFLFVGNLSEGKRPLSAIKIFENILNRGINARLDIYGSGIMEPKLRDYIKKTNLEPFIRLMGNKELSILKEAYRYSHFIILHSKSEGWPKVIAEAMFFGCIPIVSNISCIPWMIGDEKRGILINDDLNLASRKVMEVLKDKKVLKKMSDDATSWSRSYTLDRFEMEMKKLL